MKVLILEDDSTRMVSFMNRLNKYGSFSMDWETTADGAIAKLCMYSYDYIFLDHDLDGLTFVDPSEPNTGTSVARWISRGCLGTPKIYVHSLNGKAGMGMVDIIGDSAEYLPGAWMESEFPLE